MESSKKILLSTIGIAILIVLVSGVTFAFFNYTRTGASNVIKVGRISFVSKDEQTITLNNLFPIDPTEQGIMDDNTKVGTYSITIEGDTDYSGGIEYLVSTVNSNLSTLPISINMTVGSGLGTSDTNYFTTRETATTPIYKKIIGSEIVGDQMLLVGFIPQNTTLGTSDETGATITIKAYLDKNKILISDTYDGTESDNMGTPNSLAEGKTVLTTTEWNALSSSGISFQIKVEANEGIWVKGSLEEIMKQENFDTTKNRGILDNESSEFVSASTGINFGAISSDTNGKGVYMRAGTENDSYPILYYRGAVDNNNVVFNNKCWKAVRTTDTGGVKLIYNGEMGNVYEKAAISLNQYNILTNTDGTNTGVWTFDSTDNSWNTSYTSGSLELSFKVPAGDGYKFEMTGQRGSSGSGGYTIYKGTSQVNGGGVVGETTFALNYVYGTLTADDVVKFTFSGGGFATPATFKIKMIAPEDLLTANGCDNIGTDAQITVNNTNTFAFNTNYNSPAYNGYMYGETYTYSNSNWTSGARFGSSFTWDGTNYTLVDDTVTTPNATHHYSCNVTTANGTCTQLRYVYFLDGSAKYYITLTGGDGIEEALVKMQTNTNDSYAKNIIETWYASQMNTVTNKLEDTIWCNDRSFGDRWNSGWKANGSIKAELYYGAKERSNNAQVTSSTVKNQPSLACANKNDSFTWKNNRGNGTLDYPVGLLTEDEMVLAGGVSGIYNTAFYLNSAYHYWSLSPFAFEKTTAREFGITMNGQINYGTDVSSSNGLRPSVSLKPGTPVVSGSGTVATPYVIDS